MRRPGLTAAPILGVLSAGALLLGRARRWPRWTCCLPSVLSVEGDVRLSAADGEPSWLQDGFGKTRYGGTTIPAGPAAATGLRRRHLASAFAFDLTGYVDAVYQPGRRAPGGPVGGLRPLQAPAGRRRPALAGARRPDVSAGVDGERRPGLDADAHHHALGHQQLDRRGVQGGGRRGQGRQALGRSGGLRPDRGRVHRRRHLRHPAELARLVVFRPALHGPSGETADPQRPGRAQAVHAPGRRQQGRWTRSTADPGFYAWGEWRAPHGVTANLFYYDNAGDRTTITDGNWAWDTRFWNLGLRYAPDADTEFLAQAMTGRTVTGFLTPVGWRVDADFDAAYLLASRKASAPRTW